MGALSINSLHDLKPNMQSASRRFPRFFFRFTRMVFGPLDRLFVFELFGECTSAQKGNPAILNEGIGP